MYVRLAEGPDDLLVSERSRTRRFLVLMAAVVLLAGGLLLAAGVGSAGVGLDKAVAADDNRDGDSDSSRGASVSNRSHGTDDRRGHHSRG